jgi:hypothetical protein
MLRCSPAPASDMPSPAFASSVAVPTGVDGSGVSAECKQLANSVLCLLEQATCRTCSRWLAAPCAWLLAWTLRCRLRLCSVARNGIADSDAAVLWLLWPRMRPFAAACNARRRVHAVASPAWAVAAFTRSVGALVPCAVDGDVDVQVPSLARCARRAAPPPPPRSTPPPSPLRAALNCHSAPYLRAPQQRTPLRPQTCVVQWRPAARRCRRMPARRWRCISAFCACLCGWHRLGSISA